MSVQVSAIGFARFGKRPEGLVELAAESANRALEGIGRRPIDLLVVGTMLDHGPRGPASILPTLASRLGLEAAAGYRVDGASATGAMAFQHAVLALESGRFERALVVAAEKMTDRPTAELTGEIAGSLHASEVAAGATLPALAALITQRYLERYGGSTASLDAVSVHARAMAARNPNAQFRDEVTREGVAASRPIALPLRLLHCSAISDGAVAVVLERGDGPATVRGFGQGFDAVRIVDRSDLTTSTATRVAAQRAYESARLTRREIEVAEVHDAFAPFALLHLEDLGFCGPGESAEWFEKGWVAPDGRLPVNPSGGLIGRGHPIGATGLAAIAEVALQLRAEAAGHAIAHVPRVGLAQSVGGIASQNWVTILGREGA